MPDPQPSRTLGPFDGVLFDNDGVLVDSHAHGEIAWRTLCDRFGLPFDEIVTTFVGRRPEDTFGEHLDGERLATAIDELEALEIELAAETPVLHGAIELLDALTLPWTVVTSASLPLAVARWQGAGLRVPEQVVSAESVSRGKPDPQPYLAGAELLGVDPERVLVFEDAPAGGLAATAAGCTVVAVGDTPWTIEPAARVPDLSFVRIAEDGAMFTMG